MSDAAELSPGRTLWEALGDIPDRRGAKGRRYPLRSVLTLSLAAMLAGGHDLCSIFRWGRRLPPEALYLLGLKRAPCHAMSHYVYKALDVAATEQVLGAWAQGSRPLGTVAIDGKRLRGSAPAGHDGSEGVHVVAAFASQLGAVIGQVQVAPEADEITAALALLKSLPLAGAIITGDAAFCPRAVCQGVRNRNSWPTSPSHSATPFPPELIKALGEQAPCDALWDGPPPDLEQACTVEKGHGRLETRRIATSREVVPHLDWPGVAQVGRIEREREIKGQTSREGAYAVTSLTREQAGPEALLSLVRGHWAIENQLHWRRDVSLREDACRVRSGCAPQALAALRNTVLRLARVLPGPLAAVRQTLAENRLDAILLATQGFL